MDEKQRFDEGMKMRRQVLGDAHVDRSLERLTPFNRDFQQLITRYAWGEVWSRPGLSLRTRSLLTLVLMVALHREEEFRMHVPAAFRNGVTREEISEALLHASIYCGLPAANAAMKWAEQEIEKIDAAETS
jgi:4-carboxymuconolactone decarboxylase